MTTQNAPINVRLSLGGSADIKAAGADGLRPFSGIANSGRPFFLWGERYVVDFDNLKHKPKVPVLIEHDRTKRAGVAELTAAMPDGLRADGVLLANTYGKEVADDSDGDFPWEMSIDVRSAREERLSEGGTAVVNGVPYQGPLRILRDCTVREVSFVALGQDPNTSAVALADDGTPMNPPQTKEPPVNKTPEQNAAPAADAQLAQENATLKAELAKAQTDAELAKAGYAFADGKPEGISATTYQVLLAADAEQRAALLADLKPMALAELKPAVPGVLLADSAPANDLPETSVKLAAATNESQFMKGARYV